MRIPPRLPWDMEPAHGAMAAEEVLDGPREHMMDAGASIRGRRPLIEDPGRRVGASGLRGREDPIGGPPAKDLLFEVIGRAVAGEEAEARGGSRIRHDLQIYRPRSPKRTVPSRTSVAPSSTAIS